MTTYDNFLLQLMTTVDSFNTQRSNPKKDREQDLMTNSETADNFLQQLTVADNYFNNELRTGKVGIKIS